MLQDGSLIWLILLCGLAVAAAGKLVGFYLIKAALGLASAATEAWLYR